jgi:hypothetical protein
MSQAWATFARHGNPSFDGIPVWLAYNVKDRATMILEAKCRVVNDPFREERLTAVRHLSAARHRRPSDRQNAGPPLRRCIVVRLSGLTRKLKHVMEAVTPNAPERTEANYGTNNYFRLFKASFPKSHLQDSYCRQHSPSQFGLFMRLT